MGKNDRAAKLFFALLNLARLRIVGMELVACATGFILAYRGEFLLPLFSCTLLGTAFLSAGACAVNCYLEREQDALMPRTCKRPIPAGTISAIAGLSYGMSLLTAGFLLLVGQVNMLAAGLGLAAAVIYLAVYTPAKRVTWLNTSIGAIPGAIPPLIGWAAARGQIDLGGWILFAMLFVWQHTHFFPIAWLYKDDYEKGGFKMLPVVEATGVKTFRLTLLTAVALLPVSMMLCGQAKTGTAYGVGTILSCLLLIAASFQLAQKPSRAAARKVLLVSLIYLPILLGAVVIDRYGGECGSQVHAWLGTVWRWT
ncbi:MAG: heme o synthase [Cyanobacteria bacterium REEB67]|nr:heme o synthase [Cyanobacteria bacterium REEB67]